MFEPLQMYFWYIPPPGAEPTGVFEVLPATALEGLTAEDLRLLLNGQIGHISVHTLISYTSSTT